MEPGEIVTISDRGLESDRSHCGKATGECVFEFIYFARPDSRMDGATSTRRAVRMGERLAVERRPRPTW